MFGKEVRALRVRVGRAYVAATATTVVGVVTAFLSASVVVAAPASADSGADFLAVVSETGINVGDSPADVVLTLSRGMLACRLLHYGYPTEVAIREVGYGFPDATPAQLVGFVDAAKATLCEPNFRQLNPGTY
ncbi:hypothetical protein MAHJHV65_18770 [Mycobacterium avium subsp. hominissuis]